MKILLLFNKKEREENIAILIKNAIHSQSPESRIVDVYWDEPENDITEIVRFSPDVVVTFPLTIPDLIEEISVIKALCKSIVCTLTTEGFATPQGIEQAVGYYSYPSYLVDYYLFFGSKYAKIYCECLKGKKILERDDKAIVVGYPMWEWDKLAALEKYTSVDEQLKQSQQNYKKTVLVLSGFAEANKNIKQIKVCNDSYDANATNKEEQIQHVLKHVKDNQIYREKYYNLLVELAKRMPDVKFILKLHPVEVECYINKNGYDFSEMEAYKNIEIIKDNIPVCFYLKYSDVLIHYGSTVSVEAYLLNVSSICIEGLYGDVFKSDLSIKDFDIEKVEEFINASSGISIGIERDKFCYDYFNYVRDCEYHPSERIAQFLLELNLEMKETQEKAFYIDNGYYNKLQKAYFLMSIKQFAEMHMEKGRSLLQRSFEIRKIRSKLNNLKN